MNDEQLYRATHRLAPHRMSQPDAVGRISFTDECELKLLREKLAREAANEVREAEDFARKHGSSRLASEREKECRRFIEVLDRVLS